MRAASIAASKQCAGLYAATIGSGASPWRPYIAMQQVGLLGLGRQAGRRAAALDVDDHQRQLEADREADRLATSGRRPGRSWW